MTDKTQGVEVKRSQREAVARMLVSAGVYADTPLEEPSRKELAEWVATGEHPDETCRRGLEAFVQALREAESRGRQSALEEQTTERAEAWEEGYEAGVYDEQSSETYSSRAAENPYKMPAEPKPKDPPR